MWGILERVDVVRASWAAAGEGCPLARNAEAWETASRVLSGVGFGVDRGGLAGASTSTGLPDFRDFMGRIFAVRGLSPRINVQQVSRL